MTEAHIGHGFLSTALEGGIGYWARAYNIQREQLTGDLAMDDFTEYVSVELVEFEDEIERLGLSFNDYTELDEAFDRGHVKSYTVTADALLEFFTRVVNLDVPCVELVGMRRAFAWAQAYHEDHDYPDLDAEDCDVMVQAVALGSIVYG